MEPQIEFMMDPYFFGYGSLVNTSTHGFANAQRATARGWRRAWRHTQLREVSFLTAVPDEMSRIDGVIASVPGADWAALDQREHAYERLAATNQVDHQIAHPVDIAIYAIAPDRHGAPSQDHPILMSYLETVLQGYLHQFGPEGVTGFIATTDGWDAPIRDDRSAPVYPRHQPISQEERDMFRDCLTDIGARILMPRA